MRTTRVLSERRVSLKEGSRLGGESWHTLYRWSRTGKWSRVAKKMVTLDWCYKGGQIVTSVQAYERFMRELNGETE